MMGFTGVLGGTIRTNAGAKLSAALGCGIAFEVLLYAAPLGWLTAVCVGGLLAAMVVFGQGEALRSPALLLAGAGVVALIIEPHWASFLLAFLGLVSVALLSLIHI